MLLDLVHVHLKHLVLGEAIESAAGGSLHVRHSKAWLKARITPTCAGASLVDGAEITLEERAGLHWYQVRVPSLDDGHPAENEDERLPAHVQVCGGTVDIP